LNVCDKEKRSYIIDRGTIHLLTGVLSREDFQAIKQKKTVKMDEKRMELTLQRVQLVKSQVRNEISVMSLKRCCSLSA
jgi:dopamine beta-monooxygenase